MRRAAPAIVVALVLLLPVAFMYRTLLLGQPLARDDAAEMVYPLARAMGESLRQGKLYLWDEDQWCGLPALATGQSTALYPIHLVLFALLPWMTALHLSYWLHLALMGLGVVWVGRNLRLSWAGALLAATAYCWSGYVAAHLIHLNVVMAAAHLPLMLALLQTAQARYHWGWWALLAVECGCAFLSAHPQIFIMAVAACGLWLIAGRTTAQVPAPPATADGLPARAPVDPSLPSTAASGGDILPRTRGPAPALGLTVAAMAAVLLTMPQLLPELELAAQGRLAVSGGAAYMGSFPFTARDLARVLLPSIFGTVHDNILGGGPAYHESCAFVGAAPLLLALVGLLVGRGRPGYGFALSLFVVGAALMPGPGNPLHALLARLPFFGNFRAMGRWAILPILSVSLLAGMALTWLPSALEGRRRLAAQAVAGLASVIVLVVLALWYTFAVDEAGRIVLPGQPHRAVPIKVPADAIFNCMVGWEPVLLLLATAAVVAYISVATRPRLRPLTHLVVLIAVATPLWHHWQITNRTVPRAYYTEPPHSAVVILQAGVGRITTLPPELADPNSRAARRPGYRDDRPDLGERELLNPALATVFDIPYADGYKQGLVTPSTLKIWENYRHYGSQAFSGIYSVSAATVELYGTPVQRMKRMHELCAIQYIVTTGELADPDLEVVSEGRVRVYRYRAARPRAWLALRPITIADPQEQLEAVKRRDFDPRRDVVVDQSCSVPEDATAGTVNMLASGGGRVVVQVDSSRGGVLVLADAWHPGWEATVNGKRAQIMRANAAFRAVPVPAGAVTVEFYFRPRPWRIGLALMGVGLALVMGMVVAGVRPGSAGAMGEVVAEGGAGVNR